MGGLMGAICLVALVVGFAPDSTFAWNDRSRYGKLIGKFSSPTHAVNGTVYAMNKTTIFIKSFSFKGDDNDNTYFKSDVEVIGYLNSKKITSLSTQHNVDITLDFPSLKNLEEITFISVARKTSNENEIFGDVLIPQEFKAPDTFNLGPFKPKAGDSLKHGLSSGDIIILDAKTFFIPKLNYKGDAPKAFFWVGNGAAPHEKGIKVPDENQSYDRLRTEYKSKNITIKLPGNLTVYEIQWLSMWCVQFKQNFGYVSIPHDLNVPPAFGQKYTEMYSNAIPCQANFLNFILIIIPVAVLR